MIPGKRRCNGTFVYNPEKGRLEEEPAAAAGLLRFLYGSPLGRLGACVLTAGPLFSRLVGALQSTGLSARWIRREARRLGIVLEEFQVPQGGFRSFNDFFIRRFKPGVRSIDPDPASVISPCDARLLVVPDLSPKRSLFLKGAQVCFPHLLGSSRLAGCFSGGTAFVYRLSLGDYHRFHFPEAGVPQAPVRLGRRLHSVHPVALASGMRILDRNCRYRTLIESTRGLLCMLEIGALCVGSVVQRFRPGRRYRRGQEKGYFQFGGSTVVVLYQRSVVIPQEEMLRRSQAGIETLVRLGRPVGRYTCGT